MEKMKMHSPDLTQQNIEKIRALFPSCVTEAQGSDGKITLAIDFDQLKQELSGAIVEGPQERYHLNWPGKREALLTANAPIAKTLRPCREESVDFDTTQNLFIEGDNLDALKLLQETYLGKVKMIYIDPPYNTGNDFIYSDDFSEDIQYFKKRSNQNDTEGNQLIANTESNGRFHSDWMSMVYSRLKIARNLLCNDGILICSIDEHEISNLHKIMGEVFSENNIDTLIWRKNGKQGNTKKILRFKTTHEYLIIAYKNKKETRIKKVKLLPNWKGEKTNADNDPRGNWESGVICLHEDKSDPRSKNFYTITLPSGRDITREFFCSKIELDKLISEGRIFFPKKGDGIPRLKIFEKEEQEYFFDSIIDEMGTFTSTKEDLGLLLGNKDIFDTPKPVKMIKELMRATTNSNSLVLDFFAGSGTTAHSLFELNAEDGGGRRFIAVQLSEHCSEKSEAFKNGYRKITELSKDRIRKAGENIVKKPCDHNWNQDIGFRVLKVDTSNMSEIYYSADQISQGNLELLVNNIKEDRTDEDLLFQVLLDWSVDLTLPIRKETICNKTVFFVDDNALVACFDSNITEELIKELAALNPLRVVFRDDGFASDAVKINAEQIFKQLAPGTEVKSI
ncbi:site-specific DNA-methyltransferase [Endozoicomonas sp. Mp262]|uniref:site-specific DNA-methyltransferase n=1 Tax=Endozoicomonas sp. Mp262 TaxID=2919499 RepID=UPI0021DF8191